MKRPLVVIVGPTLSEKRHLASRFLRRLMVKLLMVMRSKCMSG